MAVILILLQATDSYADEWIYFISCGFESIDVYDEKYEIQNIRTVPAPNLRLVKVRIRHIEFIREYFSKSKKGVTCSSIHFISGDEIFVIGSITNIIRRIRESLHKNNN